MVAARRGELMNKKLGCQSSLRRPFSLGMRIRNFCRQPSCSGARSRAPPAAPAIFRRLQKMIHAADIKGMGSYIKTHPKVCVVYHQKGALNTHAAATLQSKHDGNFAVVEAKVNLMKFRRSKNAVLLNRVFKCFEQLLKIFRTNYLFEIINIHY